MGFLTPSAFQGSLKKSSYFEGWYIKSTNPQSGQTLALIPGVSLGKDSHGFIQIIDSAEHKTAYIRFATRDFGYSKKEFDISLGANRFSSRGIELRETRDSHTLSGELIFTGTVPFPVTLGSPGIMGPYRYAPFLECYHGVVSADHRVDGEICWNGTRYLLDKGRGYVEKDWGHSMPSSWIWIHCNLFEEAGTSFMLSVARVPWLGREFTGHLGFLYTGGRYHRFASYLKSRVILENLNRKELSLNIRAKDFAIEVKADLDGSGGTLQAPVQGDMARTIRERVDTPVSVIMKDPAGKVLFQGQGRQAGLEMTGNPAELL